MMDAPMPLHPSQRPWLVDTTPGPVIFQDSDLPDYEEKIPEIDRRAELSDRFRDGEGTVDPSDAPDVVRLRGK